METAINPATELADSKARMSQVKQLTEREHSPTHEHVGFWGNPIYGRWTSLTAQSVKNLPAMQETWV